jgi:hypothetical protein
MSAPNLRFSADRCAIPVGSPGSASRSLSKYGSAQHHPSSIRGGESLSHGRTRRDGIEVAARLRVAAAANRELI